MKPISKAAQNVFDRLVYGLEPGQARKLDSEDGYMPLHVERLSADRYSLAHYFEQNGDLVADPDGEFWRGPDGRVYPVALQQCTGHYTRAVEFNAAGQPARFSPRAGRELASFAGMWLRNIKVQQLGTREERS